MRFDILFSSAGSVEQVEIKKPSCYIVAGPNGAGKTTFALEYLPGIAQCHDFINADEIAKGLSPLNFEAGLVKASRIFLETLDDKINARRDFAFETTLSGRSYLTRIPEWRRDGWEVNLIYLYVSNAGFSASRVHQRVLQGGHDIPLRDIERRFPRSLSNLFDYAEICDMTLCFDNMQRKAIPIFEKRMGCPIEVVDEERFLRLKKGLLK